MKVKDLIRELEELDPEAEVVVRDTEPVITRFPRVAGLEEILLYRTKAEISPPIPVVELVLEGSVQSE